MEEIYIKEGNSEVLIILNYHCNNQLETLQEAAKALQREVLRVEANYKHPKYDRPKNGY